jgi:hypothetical protein
MHACFELLPDTCVCPYLPFEPFLFQEILGDLAGFWPMVFASGLGPSVMRDVSSMAPPTWNLAYDLVRWGMKHMDYLVRG